MQFKRLEMQPVQTASSEKYLSDVQNTPEAATQIHESEPERLSVQLTDRAHRRTTWTGSLVSCLHCELVPGNCQRNKTGSWKLDTGCGACEPSSDSEGGHEFTRRADDGDAATVNLNSNRAEYFLKVKEHL